MRSSLWMLCLAVVAMDSTCDAVRRKRQDLPSNASAVMPLEETSTATPDLSNHTTTPEPKYLAVKVCHKVFYCQEGLRGPCMPNEVLMLARNGTADDHALGCKRLSNYPWAGCLSSRNSAALSRARSADVGVGKCVLRNPWRPCLGYPVNYRYHLATKKCYATTRKPSYERQRWARNQPHPCKFNQIFTELTDRFGDCRCRNKKQLFYEGSCYMANSKGPCGANEWLELSDRGEGACHKSPCPPAKRNGRFIFWEAPVRSGKSGCYESNTQGPCPRGRVFIIDDYLNQSGRCVRRGWRRPTAGWQRPVGGWQRPAGAWNWPAGGWKRLTSGWQRPGAGWQRPVGGRQWPFGGWQRPTDNWDPDWSIDNLEPMDGDSEFWDKNSLDSSEFDFENADDDESLQSIEDLID